MEDTGILTQEAFSLLVSAFFEAGDKGLTECTLLEVVVRNQEYGQAAKALAGSIRATDYMGVLGDGKLYVLLSNTDEKNAAGVMERFRKAGYECRSGKGQ